jgi:hypothetical protein
MSDLENYYEVHLRPPEFNPMLFTPPLSWQGSDCSDSEKSIKPYHLNHQENSIEFQKTRVFDLADNQSFQSYDSIISPPQQNSDYGQTHENLY